MPFLNSKPQEEKRYFKYLKACNLFFHQMVLNFLELYIIPNSVFL